MGIYESKSFPSIKGKLLFVGNAVPQFSGTYGFYYLNDNNSFWKNLDFVFYDGDEVFESLRKRYNNATSDDEHLFIRNEIIKKANEKGIGLTDVIMSCTNLHGSSDKGITNIVYNDKLIGLIEESDVIFLNGKKDTYDNFTKALGDSYKIIANTKKIVVLPSSSNANAIKNKKEKWKELISPYI